MEQKFPLLIKAREYAVRCHESTNHFYDKTQPYSIHLNMVADIAVSLIQLIPTEYRERVLAACWCHDVIEDTRQTYNDVKELLGVEVAEIVYACTNEKGKNRAERANDKYYEGISKVPFATFVKVCDRIANMDYSKQKKSSMYNKYLKENEHFISKLRLGHPHPYDPFYKDYEDIFEVLVLLAKPETV